MNTIMIIAVVLLFLAAIIRNIDWRAIAVKWVGNNPAKSQHYIEAGDTVHTVEGHRVMMAAEGQVYVYDDLDKETYIIDVENKYPYKYIRGRRIIGQSDGVLVANPLGYFRPEQVANINEGLTEVSQLSHGDLLIRAIKSVKSNKTKNMIIWLLVAAVLAGGYMWYRNNNKPEVIPTANVTQNVTMPTTVQPGLVVPVVPSEPLNPPIERTTP